MQLITIIDYSMGNLASVKNALNKIGCEAEIVSEPESIVSADKVILPGVGAFADAIKHLRNKGIDQSLQEVVRKKVPLLGICLGMQLLFTESYENGVYSGLDIIPGTVEKFVIEQKVPHMGWNSIDIKPESKLFAGINAGSFFYFVHSYYVRPNDPQVSAASCHYGVDFCCAVEKENIFATQFHPEKSSDNGLQILKNFGEMKI
ncbi:MAG: imidazole glycerol phosphate synthase subunit HisH [Bacillota bacterium]|nr:imidazole glycerol phosphate synthase subunit HisH [Bacillota bacterium]